MCLSVKVEFEKLYVLILVSLMRVSNKRAWGEEKYIYIV